MKQLILIALLVFFTLSHEQVKPEDPVQGIIDVTSANKAEVFDTTKHTLVEFYAPWCGHCKNLAPEMHKLGEVISKDKPTDVRVAKVNCDAERDICSQHGVNGYPTLKFFPKGSSSAEDYRGGRTVEDLVNFLNDKTGSRLRYVKPPEFVVTLTPDNFDKIVKDPTKDVLVEFYAPWCGHCKALAPKYEQAAKAFQGEENVVVAKIDADKYRDFVQPYGISGFPTLKFFAKGSEKKPTEYTGDRSVEGLVKFLNQKAGTHRTVDGLLDDNAGLEESLNEFVSKYVSSETKAQLIEEAEAALKKLDSAKQASAAYYIKAMKNIKDKGEEWLKKEKTRLKNLLDNAKSVSAKALDNVKRRLNILNKFN